MSQLLKINLTFLQEYQHVHNFTCHSDPDPAGSNPSLATQPVVGLWTQRRTRAFADYLTGSGLIGENLDLK